MSNTLGQREIGIGDALTADEIEYIEKNEVTLPLLHAVLGLTNSRMTLDALIGGALNILKAIEEGKIIADPRPVDPTVLASTDD